MVKMTIIVILIVIMPVILIEYNADADDNRPFTVHC